MLDQISGNMKSLGREKKKISEKQKSRSRDISSIFLQYDLVLEILSRLPVKTLMRFKCVCKGWLSLIEDDSYFIDLHLNRSKLRPCFTLAIPRELDRTSIEAYYCHPKPNKADILIADLVSETGRITAGATPILANVRKMVSSSYNEVSKPVNGLICFTSKMKDNGICVYNLSTRELSPWITTTFPMKKRRFINHHPAYQFGFDPATKEHKVICLWDYEDYDSVYYKGSLVMTIGANTWRTVDEVPPYHLEQGTAIYANGSINWITFDLFHEGNSERKLLIVAFDVGSEKFKIVAVPKFITDQIDGEYDGITHLLEVNDRVALAHVLPHGDIAMLWILDDTTNWREVTLKLPFQWDENKWIEFHGIAGTGQILLESYNDRTDMKQVSIYSYDWNSKAFTEVETSSLYSSIPNPTAIPEYEKKDESLCETFTESLVRVQERPGRSTRGVSRNMDNNRTRLPPRVPLAPRPPFRAGGISTSSKATPYKSGGTGPGQK